MNKPFNSIILTILFVVFLVLKLTGEINWSWWWVTSPLWLPAAAILVVVNVLAIILFVGGLSRRNK
jgi:hypothetical protein